MYIKHCKYLDKQIINKIKWINVNFEVNNNTIMILLCRYIEIHNISGLLPFMRISLGKFRFLFQQSFQNHGYQSGETLKKSINHVNLLGVNHLRSPQNGSKNRW